MMEKFIHHDLGPTGLRLEKWVTQPRVGVYVQIMPDVLEFLKRCKMGVF